MAAEPQRKWSFAEYLEYDRESDGRHEYYNGEIFAMAGASRKHNLVNGNMFAALRRQVMDHGCEIYTSDMRVRIPATDLGTYPDLVVVCGEPRFEDDREDTLLNPTLVAEVLSPTTEDCDHGKKFAHYRTVPAVQVYLMVAQDEVLVELYERKTDKQWLLSEFRDPRDVIDVPAIGARLALADVYDHVPGFPGRGPES